MLGLAQTGTGKTAAFALPILQRLAAQNEHAAPKSVRALILAPTRELAVQISDSFKTYGRHLQLRQARSEEHTSELQSLMRNSYAVFCLKKQNHSSPHITTVMITQHHK